MDTASIAPFSANVQIAKPLSIVHIIALAIGSFSFYPFFLTQPKKVILLWCAVGCNIVCFFTSWFIQSDLQFLSAILFGLFLFQLWSIQLKRSLPAWIELSLGFLILAISILYSALVTQDLTESCDKETSLQCRLPLIMGTGFLIYGTCVLLHLVSILKLPRRSTPEYYEALALSFWGLFCLIISGTSILGSEWKALNLGLLWFTGGLLSISLTVQTWMPVIRERNIVNSLIICLTGRAIVIGRTDKDNYAATVHTLLGHLLIIGSLARLLQIIFRKSAIENYGLFQTEQESKNEACKHTTVFASITMMSSLLVSIVAVTVGVLFMGSSHDWLTYMRYYLADPSIYLNCIVAIAFLWCAYVFVLCTIYNKQNHRLDLGHPYEYLELENAIESNNEPTIWEPTLPAEPIEPIMISPTTITTATIATTNNNINAEETKHMEKSMRPSEYRAKRRSLLVQPLITSNFQRSRSSSGVGGVLPDEMNLQKSPDYSKRSSGGSTGYFSKSPISSPENIPFASVSSTYPNTSYHPRNSRRNSAGPLDYLSLEERSVHKTESGRRKERLIQNNYDYNSNDNDVVLSKSSGQRWSKSFKEPSYFVSKQ